MAQYLSTDWFEQVNHAVRSDPDLVAHLGGATFSVQQVVASAPDGEVAYWLRLDGGAVTTGMGRVTDPDVTITQSYDTAVAVVRGELSAEAAFLAGRLRLAGDLRALAAHQGVLQRVGAAAASVRASTSYA